MLARLIGAGRVGLGVVAVASPRLAGRLFALPPSDINPSFSLLSRLVGDRELGLGAVLLLAPDADLPLLLATAAAVDGSDALCSLWSMRDGLSRRGALVSAVSAALTAAIEVAALRRTRGRGNGSAAAE